MAGDTAASRFSLHHEEEYSIEYADRLDVGPLEWLPFENAGTLTADSESSFFVDDFTPATSGAPMASGKRFYRVTY